MAAPQARVQVVNRTRIDGNGSDHHVELQWCRYIYGSGSLQYGYRFIWVDPGGRLRPQRGQARLPSLKLAMDLMAKAKAAGWGDYDADDMTDRAA